MQAEGLILAGGRSRRMGGIHKGILIYKEETFTQILIKELKKEIDCVRISYGSEIREDCGACPVVMDIYPGCGPIGGIHAGLKSCKSRWLAVAACDMPLLKTELFCLLTKRLSETEREGISYDGAVPVLGGRIHPLAAIYQTGAAEIFEEQIRKGNYRLRDALKRLNILYVDLAGRKLFEEMLQNINTAEEYERLVNMSELTLEQAQKLLLERTERIEETEIIPLWEGVGRTLAEDILARHDQPPFPRSPLDGYAVRSRDIEGASKERPVRLAVIDEVDAGYVSSLRAEKGTAIRIMTGAPIPEGADCIVRQEDTDYGEETVEIYKETGAYENYCFAGEDYKAGSKILEKGARLGAVEIGTLASLGLEKAQVFRKVRAAVLTTGDELALPGEELKPGKIYDSNLYMLVTRLTALGVEAVRKGRTGDNPKEAAAWIREAAKEADIILTTGGVSVGKKDIMHDVLKLLNCQRIFWKIAVKPGMPTLCAQYERKLLICLSGNPFGAAANLELLVRPVLAKMAGRKELEPKRLRAEAESEFPKRSGVTRYVRGFYEDGKVRIPEGSNASGILSSMCGCNCLIEIPAGTPALKKGDEAWIILL